MLWRNDEAAAVQAAATSRDSREPSVYSLCDADYSEDDHVQGITSFLFSLSLSDIYYS